jgi:Uma2 family endonuclease
MRALDVIASLPQSDPGGYVPADLDVVPEDVTLPPSPAHQRVLLEVACTLRNACPEGLQVLPAPVRFQPTTGLSLLPDVLVCRREEVGPRHIDQPLLLAVAISAQMTRDLDAGYRRALYELSGVQSYWMFDMEHTTLTVLELEGGRYVERTFVTGDEVFVAEIPFPVKLVPKEIIR